MCQACSHVGPIEKLDGTMNQTSPRTPVLGLGTKDKVCPRQPTTFHKHYAVPLCLGKGEVAQLYA